ncbi:DNA photolyase, FAD-binding/Cryptochrome [Lentinula aciculospora]|uniref:Cryptochrome DASH n=1 Tax=Lentinula aciculospora TaxID=153920 RepID=A0A9W9AUE0_9AGAR|nr:DNA photolyase, FAD-binding/Cryptochrome [Lentinula aciculospora]
MYLIYLLRRDLRISDNPVFHHLQQQHSQFSHVLPLYILSPSQIEVSGLLQDEDSHSPYPQARSRLGKFWRCGPHRAKFLAESIWDLKQSLKDRGSNLVIRVGKMDEVVGQILKQKEFQGKVAAVWMTKDWASEEIDEEHKIERVVKEKCDGKIECKVWDGEEMLLHDDDFASFDRAQVPDVFTSFRKSFEPLRDNIRPPYNLTLSQLPPLPPYVLDQAVPFFIPTTLEQFISAVQNPVLDCGLGQSILHPQGASTAHPFIGGETRAHERIRHLLVSGSISTYKDTRNGLLGQDFSTKLSAYLALGCITARQVNAYMLAFEDGKNCPDFGTRTNSQVDLLKAEGFGKGENKGTSAVRFELLWRDYMRLCMRKYGNSLFSIEGFRGAQRSDSDAPFTKHQKNKLGSDSSYHWSDLSSPDTRTRFTRFLRGETGTGLIDASMRELALTGYTSNRTRQNCASFLAKSLWIDWRLGAEWYECMLTDYDVASNWGNWAYVAGVGNDPRGREDGKSGSEGRKFNPVKQAWDYDFKGEYVKAWIVEFEDIPSSKERGPKGGWVDVMFQAWQVHDIFNHTKDEREREVVSKLKRLEWVNNPLVKIRYQPKGRR